MKLKALIEEKYDGMSGGHKRIAAFILANEKEFLYLTSRNVAEKTGVSEATVVRFAYYLGFPRYRDLQEFARHSHSLNDFNIIEQFKAGSARSLMEEPHMKAVETDIKNIQDTFAALDPKSLYAAVDALLRAKRIGVVAFRGALAPALLLYHFLCEMFENTVLLSPGIGNTFDVIKNWNDEDVLVGFEYSPSKNHTFQTLKFGRQRGCKIIAVINELPYTIRELSDIVLEVKKDGTFISYTASVVLVNVLLDLIAQKAQGRIMENYEETFKILKMLDRGMV